MSECKTILLVSANRHREPYPVYPLGLSYLKTYLDRTLTGFRIMLFDCNLDPLETLSRVIREECPAYVGVSLRNVDGANSLDRRGFIGGYLEVVKAVREATRVPLIIGGAGFSIFPEIFMRELGADYGIVGEGEESLRKLILALERGESTERIEGVLRRGAQGVEPALPHRCYLRTLEVEFDDRLVDYYWKYSGMLNIQTKRGCPYRCVYCSYPLIDGRVVRTLDPEMIVENMARLNRDKGVNYLFFTDSVFNIVDEYNVSLAEKLIRSGLQISWGAYFSPHNLTDELVGLFKRAGLTHVEFGTESLSDECLAKYGKNFNFDHILESSRLCLKHNVYYAHFLILGGYGETPDTLRETMEHSKQIAYTVFFPYVGMRIYPHTGLHSIAVREGVVTADDPLLEPRYYLVDWFDLEQTRMMARQTGKAWVFPDDPQSELMDVLRLKRHKKGPIWEYLRRP